MGIKPILYELDYFPDAVSVYESVRNEPYSSFLDSGTDAGKLGRFSFIGFDPFMVVESKGEDIKVLTQDGTEVLRGNPFAFLKSLLSHYKTEPLDGDIPFMSGCIGYFSYDLRYFIEELPSISGDDMHTPDMLLSFYDVVMIFDNLLKKAYISSSGLPYLDTAKNRGRAEGRLEFAKKRIREEVYAVPDRGFSFPNNDISSNFTKEDYG
ncbi:MAG: hypothetical protein Q8R48_00990, partial [Candidatus Omnitrophota bacterium]|nr:hypothetical protein [Candidatus Omnitrophota bacterium]